MSILEGLFVIIMIITLVMIMIAIIGTGIAGIYKLIKMTLEEIAKAQS